MSEETGKGEALRLVWRGHLADDRTAFEKDVGHVVTERLKFLGEGQAEVRCGVAAGEEYNAPPLPAITSCGRVG
ncbi:MULTISPECIES: hypothetical protein [unclassified Aureimonas]|uniref:hypothetical protein n=1 Tax=unclassified Aureimonas TaxID=2615206 RepID=UPI0012E38891|nr:MULTISPECIES: hypothetical protein [unclassified Aureimonas]